MSKQEDNKSVKSSSPPKIQSNNSFANSENRNHVTDKDRTGFGGCSIESGSLSDKFNLCLTYIIC